MARPGQIFRIFVSSTFSDLKAERNALQERVFPRLRQLCAAHGARFQAIDLRWGISREAGHDQQTMSICLGEIARCQATTLRPNFIVLLGDRYGWCPLPAEIPAAEFALIADHSRAPDRDLLQRWYLCDDNAVPPVYALQPRTNTPYEDYARWQREVEQPLHALLERAALELPFTDDQRRQYIASATEQEIARGALHASDAAEHVLCFFRRIENRSKVEADRARDYLDWDAAGQPDRLAHDRLAALQDRLRQQLPGHCFEYTARWQNQQLTLDHLEQLCADVQTQLENIILAELARQEAVDPLSREIAAHQNFAEERHRSFIGRADILRTIRDYLGEATRHPLVIHGPSGSGKTALLAQAASEYSGSLVRFVGATAESTSTRSMLESLCHQLAREYGLEDTLLPPDDEALIDEFQRRLAFARADRPLVLFIDAVDRLTGSGALSSTWLARQLPPHAHLIVSTVPGEQLTVLQAALPADHLVELPLMSPADGADLLNAWLAEAGRALQPEQRADILSKFDRCGLPLYVKFAFEEARRWRSYEGLPAGADAQPGLDSDVPGVIRDLFWRLSQASHHGAVLVARSLGYLASAKNGLTEDELIDALSQDAVVMDDFRRRSPKSPPVATLPIVVWSRLYFDLQPYFVERSADGTSTLGFYHRQLDEVVADDYLKGENSRERHQHLARYFAEQPLGIEQDGQTLPNLRKLSELPYQQAHGELWEELQTTLLDFDFMQAKVSAVGPQPLIDDYDPALKHDYPQDIQAALRKIQSTLRQTAHVLVQDKTQLTSQLLGRLLDDPSPQIQSLLTDAEQAQHSPYLRPLTASLHEAEVLRRTLEGHADVVNDVAVTRNGRQAISASVDKTLRIWDLTNGVLLHKLQGHRGDINGVAVTPNGRLAVSASSDMTLKVWDVQAGKLLRLLEGHGDYITRVAITSDGRWAVSASADTTLIVWDITSGSIVRTLKEHSGWVTAVAVTSDGRRVISASTDRTLRVWDILSGACELTMKTDTAITWFIGLAVTPDGRRAVSASRDNTLKVWDLANGELLRSLEGHTGEVKGVAITPDGQKIISASSDRTLKVWDITSGKLLWTLEGHTDIVNAVVVTSDGQQAISASSDKTLKVWNLVHGQEQAIATQHGNAISAVAVTWDGKQVLTASHDGTLKAWDSASRQEQLMLRHGSPIRRIAVAQGGRQVISVSHSTVKVWDLVNGKEQFMLDLGQGHSNIAITPDGRRAVIASRDRALKVWDVLNGQLESSIDYLYDIIRLVAITADGESVVSAGEDDALRVWSLARDANFRLGTYTGVPLCLMVTADGQHVILGFNDGTLEMWNLKDRDTVKLNLGKHTAQATSITGTPDGRRAISTAHDRTLRVWDLKSQCLVATFHSGEVLRACAVAPDGVTIVAGGDSGRLHFLRLEGTK